MKQTPKFFQDKEVLVARSKKGLEWTPKQAEIAVLLRGGADPQAVIAKGYTKTMVSRVGKALKSGQAPPGINPEIKPETTPKQELASTRGETHIRPRTVESVGVGEILIEPADWRVNQYGGFLILSTYEHARQRFGYEGTVGDFLCDACQVVRKVMGLDIVSCEYLIKEDENGREPESGEETSQGAGIPGESGDELDRKPEPASDT